MRYLALALVLVGCNVSIPPAATPTGATSCRGEYSSRDSQGNLHKYNQFDINGQCFTDTVALTHWEASTESRRINNVHCTPQGLSATLISANNFYSYRDGRIYLDLNGSTGEYRRITLAEGKDGKQVFTRQQGCFYYRNDASFGRQLLLDSINVASSQAFDPMEIFTFTTTATTLESTRFDDSADWDYRFCPYLDTPWGFCDLLKSNGNIMFFPVLNAGQQASLLAEAILIRRQFNYDTVSILTFNGLWNNPGQGGRGEETREDYKYATASVVDEPRYISEAIREYVMGNRPSMPDISSSRMPSICYRAWKKITLPDGSQTRILGEVCYEDGVPSWTSQQ